MIAQMLDSAFIKKRVPELANLLDEKGSRIKDAPANLAKESVPAEDLEAAAKLLRERSNSEEFASSDAAWMPRDPLLAIVQSALEEHYRKADAVEGSQTRRFQGDLPNVTGESLKPQWIPDGTRGFARSMEESDWLGWGLSFAVAKSIRLAKGKHPFRTRPDDDVALKLDDRARLVLSADWGSGVARAQEIGKMMAKSLAETPDRERHVIHLGDVYYAGRDFEYRTRLLPYWPAEEGQNIGSWNLNANHDMFTGGHGYFAALDSDARFASQLGFSYFALESTHWLVVGLDTAWEAGGPKGDKGGLRAPQIDWLMRLRQRSPGKRLMLLSHHQPFSAFEDNSPLLQSRMEPLLKGSTPIDAWFWGHEHRCAVYKPAHNIEYAALIGHGGVPVHATKKPQPESLRFELRDSLPGGLFESFALMGFAVVDLDGPKAKISYTDEFRQNREVHEI
jgi:hypothetical protein